MRRSPPHPHLSDSRPANNRRCRSSSRLANNTIAARKLLGHQLGVGERVHESGCGHQQASGAQLVCLVRAVGRAVEELAGELVPRQPPVADELAQRQVLEPAERGAPAGAGTECRDHLGQRGDGLLAEQGNDRVGGELGWSHCGTITDSGFRNGATNRAPGPAKSHVLEGLIGRGEDFASAGI